MSVEIVWKQNILVTDFHLLKSLLVVLGFGSQAFVCGFSRQNINSAVFPLSYGGFLKDINQILIYMLKGMRTSRISKATIIKKQGKSKSCQIKEWSS